MVVLVDLVSINLGHRNFFFPPGVSNQCWGIIGQSAMKKKRLTARHSERHLYKPHFLACQDSGDTVEKDVAGKVKSQRVGISAMEYCPLDPMWLSQA